MNKPKNKTPELAAAKKALETYLKENNLDPTKDWTKDKVHGKKVTELVYKLNRERDKVAASYPEKDPKLMKKIKKVADKTAKLAEARVKAEKAKEAEVKKPAKKEEVSKKEKAARKPAKYDYPLVDGREMTADEKKKYRAEQRKKANGGDTKPKVNKKEEPKKKKVVKPSKKEKVAEPEQQPKKKLKKKAVKDED